MYKIREDFNVKLSQTKMSEDIGVTQPTLSNIFKGKVACRKVVAYCITKYLNIDAEVEDYFIKEK